MYARVKWMPFGLFEQIDICETKQDFVDLVGMLYVNKVWFDVYFPAASRWSRKIE